MRQLDDAPASYFIICEGDSTTQVRAIAEHVSVRIKRDLGIFPNHVEGIHDARWVLVDYFDVIVHVFYPETRAFYDLEDFWSDSVINYLEEQ